MFGKKSKAFAAILISLCLFSSQAAMAAPEIIKSEAFKFELSATESVKVEAPAVEETTQKNKEEVKTKISLEDAKKIVKAFKFTEGMEFTNAYLENSNGQNQPTWRIELFNPDYYFNSNIQVSISANNGELMSYNSWQGGNNKKNIVTITKKQAKEVADKFIKDYVSTNGKTLEVIQDVRISYEKSGGIYEVPQYDFNYALKVNGVMVSDFTYYIAVNAATGKISYFSSPAAYQKEAKYPSADGIKDNAALKNKYSESLQMNLQYMINYENSLPKISLAYIPTIPGMINAKTMEIINEPFYNTQNLKTNPIESDFKVVNKQITEDEAEKLAAEIKSYVEKLTGVKLSQNSDRYIQIASSSREKLRNYSYSAVIDQKNYGLQISINILTGNITSLSYYSYDIMSKEQKKVVEKVSFKDAQKTTNDILKNVFKKQYGVYSDTSEELQKALSNQKDQPDHQFSFIRFENGITTNDSASITINKETGKPSQIYLNWSDIEYPKPQSVITAEKAKELYLKDSEFELCYYTPYTLKNGTTEKSEESFIIFRPLNQASYKLVDAQTGKIVDYSGKPMQQKNINESHWAALNVEMLETQGVVLNNISDYNDKLTRQDTVKMMSLVLGVQYYDPTMKKSSYPDVASDNEYFRYIESAAANGIIQPDGKNFDGKQLITKQEFISMLANVLGYQEIMKHSELFVKTDSDLRVSVCKALDILPVKPGDSLNYNDNITYAEAAYSLQKALKYIR